MFSSACHMVSSLRIRRHCAVWLLLAALTLGALPAQPSRAQIPGQPNPVPTIDRGRIDRVEPIVPQGAPVRTATPAPSVEVKGAAALTAVALRRVRFEGSTLPPRVLQASVAPFAGSKLDKDTLQKIADAVSAAYARSDIAFYAVTIPPQVPTGGVLIIRAVEGRIVSYALNGQSSSTPTRLIGKHLARLMAETPTRKSSLERTLSLLRDIPGQTVEAKLKTTAKPDEVALDLEVKRKQVEVALNINNGGVVNVVSGVQAQVGVTVNGLLREGDVTRVSGYLPFQPDHYQFYTLSHATPIGSNGTTLGVSGAYVRTRTKGTDILGEAKQLGIAISHPLIRSYRKNLTVQVALDGTDSDNYYLDTPFGQFRTRALRLGASWSEIDKTGGYAVSLSLSQGLDALGARPLESYSETGFRKANVQGTAVKQLAKSVSIQATVRGQYTQDLLATTERFSLGGDGAGIAYPAGVATADKGVAAQVELSWQVAGKEKGKHALTLFTYADGAVARSFARPAYLLPATNYSLATAGGGVRVMPIKGWVASAQIAVPVKYLSPNYDNKARFLFSLTRTV
ncbi:hemolysin activation/secretion protein [Novosphingobium sp. PhB165]|uniref:ShlB/FhaC/HecB family hemolysin secretion/activation protein n=1 Tax=Novosphingobium sp. PhB165 TaxID=2485105 RepID=UPI0010DD2975|nr:ShlB/FhaC/HecB family hemolysin secretion/activation protein [Novosphingobium sp. PhB165]TCM15387.1 hemolysin activation/secretion protein [Novosphingobium sp. PhB165]